MKTVTLADFKAHLSAYARQVQQGKSFLLLERGRPVAKITPLDPATSEEEWEAVLRRPGLVQSPRATLPKTFFDSPFASIRGKEESTR